MRAGNLLHSSRFLSLQGPGPSLEGTGHSLPLIVWDLDSSESMGTDSWSHTFGSRLPRAASVQSRRSQSPGSCASPMAPSINTCSPSGGHSPRNHRGQPALTTSPFSRKHRPKTSFPPHDKESSNPKNSKTKKGKGNSISSSLLISSNPEKGDKCDLAPCGAVLYSYQGVNTPPQTFVLGGWWGNDSS